MKSLKNLFVAAAIAAAGSAGAVTTTFTLTGNSPDPVSIWPYGTYSLSLDGGATYNPNPSAMERYGTVTNPAGSFATFCLEPKAPLGTGGTYDIGPMGQPLADALSRLFTGAGWKSWDYNNDAVDTDLERVGLQLAVWDLAIDGAINFTSGSVRIQGTNDGFNGAAMAFALAAYNSGNTGMANSLLLLSDPVRQDLVIAVPEPSTYALMFAGLAAVGFMARRRRQG